MASGKVEKTIMIKNSYEYIFEININSQKVFTIANRQHGGDSVVNFCWQPKQGTFMAVVGYA